MVERMSERDQWVGVLMLETAFERFARDIGHPASLPFATRQWRVPRADVAAVVTSAPLAASLVEAFVAGAQQLEAQGATLITTSCGFLYREQARLSAAVRVPVVASSLSALPMLHREHGARGPLGVLTYDAAALSGHPMSGGACADTLIDGVPCAVQGLAPDCHFRDVIKERASVADPDRLQNDVIAATQRLVQRQPAAIVLECTNLAPWRDAIERTAGVPVIDLVDVIGWRLSRPAG